MHPVAVDDRPIGSYRNLSCRNRERNGRCLYVRSKYPIRIIRPVSRKKLTLSVKERLTRRAKAIADRRGTSVSRLVETFFTSLEQGESSREEGRALDLEQAETGGPEPDEDTARDLPTDYEPSKWARQWRGAFAQEGDTYPDDTSWEEGVLTEEIEKKHAS